MEEWGVASIAWGHQDGSVSGTCLLASTLTTVSSAQESFGLKGQKAPLTPIAL